MCADRTTYSFLRTGSDPGSLPTRLADSTLVLRTVALAFNETLSGKWGSGLRSFPSSAISAKVRPEPANRLSAEAGLQITPISSPGVSSNSSPARFIEGWLRLTEMRDQGMSMEAGFRIETMPITPAARKDFQRSADV